jgi:hypothetical protein
VTSSQPVAWTPGRLFDDSFLKFLPAPLREPRRAWLVLPLCLVLTLAGAAAIATLLNTLLPRLDQPDFSAFFGRGYFTIFALAVATPLIETLILAATCSILLRFVSPEAAILTSSLGWAIAHSYKAPLWGLVIFWPFIIFSTLYIVWKQRSLTLGISMPFAAHFLHNLYPSISIGFPGVLPSM